MVVGKQRKLMNKAQIKQNLAEARFVYMVRKKRLELLRLAAPEPKSGASTNFATSANCIDNLIAQIIYVMAGLLGFEPRYDGIKTRCLTAWRQTCSSLHDDRRCSQ